MNETFPNFSSSPWPFDTPPNTAVIILKQIINKERPILHVYRSYDDGMWQFLDGGTPREEDALVVSLQHVLDFDPSLCDLANLEPGWEASRESALQPWTLRYRGEE